jgi:hypothetical protein
MVSGLKTSLPRRTDAAHRQEMSPLTRTACCASLILVDNCLDMTAATPASGNGPATPERRAVVGRPGAESEKFGGLAKVDMSTGRTRRLNEGRAPGIAATLATAGGVVFWARSIDRSGRSTQTRERSSGKRRSTDRSRTAPSPLRSTGNQYVAVLVGNGGLMAGLLRPAGIEAAPITNAIHVLALP